MSFKAQPSSVQANTNGSGGFINSFLSFLGGSNAEVTIKAVPEMKKPVMPKYIPEPPKIAKPPDPLPAPVMKTAPPVVKTEPPVAKTAQPIVKTASLIETPAKKSPTVAAQNNDDCSDQSSVRQSFQDHFKKSFKGDVAFADLSDDNDGLPPPSVTKPQTNNRLTTTPVSTNQRISVSPKKRKGEYDDDDEDEELDSVSVNSTNSSSSEPRSRVSAVPVRRQSTRKAKEKTEMRRKANLQKGKKLLSLYTDPSDNSDQEEDEEEERFSEEASLKSSETEKEEDYDSDKDPVWRPGSDEPMKRRSYNDDDDYDDRPAKRKRGRKQKATTPIKPKQNQRNQAPARSTSVVSSPYNIMPDAPSKVDSPHNFARGEFVIDRAELIDNNINYPIWKIDSGRLLQKYDPIERDGHQWHHAIPTYSSWSDEIQQNFKAIKVTTISMGRGQEIVEVQEQYRPQQPAVTKFDLPLLTESFNIYIQILTSQSLESTFLAALFQEPDSYYMDPLETIDSAISERLIRIRSLTNWTDDFLKSINQLSMYRLVDHVQEGYCQATANKKCKSEKLVRFYGSVYHPKTLDFIEELLEIDGQEYDVGRETVEVLRTYHGLQHLKLNFLQKCEKKVAEVKVDKNMDDHAILDKCLLDQTWMNELLQILLTLLQNADNMKPSSTKT